MRTLSKRTQYTLRAMYALARRYGQGHMLSAKLAEEESIPHEFLENILLDMKRHGFVESKKGRGGGFSLAQPPAAITVGAVIRATEGPLAPVPCASISGYKKCDDCTDERLCGTRILMRQVRDAMSSILDQTSLADVGTLVESARGQIKDSETPDSMFYI